MEDEIAETLTLVVDFGWAFSLENLDGRGIGAGRDEERILRTLESRHIYFSP